MPLTIGCPNCPTKLKVPDNAGGRKVKCPKCGWVLTVPSGTEPQPPAREVEHLPPPPHTPEPPLTPPPPAKVHDSPPPVRARRQEDPDDRPAPPARAARRRNDDRPARRDEDYEPVATDIDRLHKGWKAVALGYRMFGLGMLFYFLGVIATVGVLVALDGVKNLETLFVGNALNERAVTELTIPLMVGGACSLLSGLSFFLGLLCFMGMPKDQDGGKGKVLAVVMFILPFVGLGAISTLLLPIFSGGVGAALNKPKLRKYGFGLFIWYVVGFMLPLLVWGAHYGIMAGLNDAVIAGIVAAVVGLIMGLLVFFSVWGTFAGMRRGIQSSIRERGIIDGEDPKPTNKSKGKKSVDRDEDYEEDREPAPRSKKAKVNREEPDDQPPPPAKRATRTEDDEDDRPKKRKRDDEDEDDRPRKRR